MTPVSVAQFNLLTCGLSPLSLIHVSHLESPGSFPCSSTGVFRTNKKFVMNELYRSTRVYRYRKTFCSSHFCLALFYIRISSILLSIDITVVLRNKCMEACLLYSEFPGTVCSVVFNADLLMGAMVALIALDLVNVASDHRCQKQTLFLIKRPTRY